MHEARKVSLYVGSYLSAVLFLSLSARNSTIAYFDLRVRPTHYTVTATHLIGFFDQIIIFKQLQNNQALYRDTMPLMLIINTYT